MNFANYSRLQKSGLKYNDILVELPVTIHNSHLVTTFLHQIPELTKQGILTVPTSVAEIEKHPGISQDSLAPNFDSLNLSIDPYLSQTCDNLLDAIDVHHNEANNFSYHNRQVARVQAQQAQWQAKRKAENAARALAKQPPLDETEWQRLYPLPQEPSRLESLLNSRQVEQYVRQTDGFVSATTGKMFSTRGNLLPHGESLGVE